MSTMLLSQIGTMAKTSCNNLESPFDTGYERKSLVNCKDIPSHVGQHWSGLTTGWEQLGTGQDMSTHISRPEWQ